MGDMFLFDEQSSRRTQTAVLGFERNKPPPRGKRPRGGDAPRWPIRGILLEDLVDGGTADMAVTELAETSEIQEVSLLGDPVTGGTFKLQFKGQTTSPIPWNATATVMQTALEALETVGTGNVHVSLGEGSYSNDDLPDADPRNEFPGIWLVAFIGMFANSTAPIPLLVPQSSLTGSSTSQMIVASTTDWIDTGVVLTVRAVVPVGSPTPMRAGAVAIAIPFPVAGYGVIACECREFTAQPYGGPYY